MTGELQHVPTAPELGARGMARERGGYWTLTPAGQAAVYATQVHNAEVLKADAALERQVEHDATKWGTR